MEEDIPVHLRSVAYYALIPTCGDKDSYRRFLKAFRYSTVKSGRVAHWSAAAWIDPPPWPRPPGSGRCFSADPEPTAPAPLSGAPRSRHQGGVYASGQPQVTIRERRSRGVAMVAPVEVGEDGIELLVGNGLLGKNYLKL